MKTLVEARLSTDERAQIIEAFHQWINEEKVDGAVVTVTKAFCRWIDQIEIDSKMLKAKLANTVIGLLGCPDMLTDLEKQKVTKRLMLFAVSKMTTECFVAFWSSSLLTSRAKMNSSTVSSWAIDCAKKGATTEKQAWERFIRQYVPIAAYETVTTSQSCHMSWKGTIESPEKKIAETFVVWNGNGIRAR